MSNEPEPTEKDYDYYDPSTNEELSWGMVFGGLATIAIAIYIVVTYIQVVLGPR